MSAIIHCPRCYGQTRVPDDLGTLVVTCPRCRCRWEWRPDQFAQAYGGDPPANTAGGWARPLLLGALCLAAAVVVSLVPKVILAIGDASSAALCQAGLTIAGAYLVLLAVLRLLRPRQAQLVRVRCCILVLAAVGGAESFLLCKSVDRATLDDHAFRLAVQKADGENSPAGLRDYLTDPAGNQRHRDEARQRIAVFYDRAIADLKGRAAAQEGDFNQSFFDGVVAILEGLKEADRPVVTVGFRSQVEGVEMSPERKAREDSEYADLVRQHPKLKEFADRSKDRSAILSVGQSFTSDEIANRDGVIFGRVEAAVRKAIGTDVLSLRRAEPGQEPMIEVAYHVYPTGTLFLYVVEDPGLKLLSVRREMKESVKGLIRAYEIDWTITVRPPNSERTYVWRLASEPMSHLRYEAEHGDPDWAPYAVVLYSAFYDMAGHLIRSFGLAPDRPPDTFTFRGTASRKTIPDDRHGFPVPDPRH